MRVVFLDFDGVILTKATKFRHPDPECIGYLNEICHHNRAAVVVSSSWRNIGLGRCRAMLKEAGFTGKVLSITPVLPFKKGEYRTRGEEIAAWLALHPEVQNYIIIDDEDDMGDLLPRLVQTVTLRGLRHADVFMAAALFEGY